MSKSKAKKPEKGNWNVIMRCTVTKVVYVTDCTREDAIKNPWNHAEDEQETEQIDWEVRKIEPTE